MEMLLPYRNVEFSYWALAIVARNTKYRLELTSAGPINNNVIS